MIQISSKKSTNISKKLNIYDTIEYNTFMRSCYYPLTCVLVIVETQDSIAMALDNSHACMINNDQVVISTKTGEM